jgi:hypothetical protein
MAKENLNLCPEKNVYVAGDARLISDKQQESVNFERTPVLDPNLRWIVPAQENCAVKMNITGVGERTSRRIWAAGLDANGKVVSVRSLGVATLRAMALGFVREGVAAPVISTTLNDEGAVRTAPGTQYVHAMEDTTWIKGENHLYVIKSPVALKPTGSSEVYQAKFVDGKMQAVDGHVELETTNMKFYQRLADPTADEAKAAAEAITSSVGENFYAL